jgi:hypothetical protein
MTGDLRPVVLDAIARHRPHGSAFTTFTFAEALRAAFELKAWPDSDRCIAILEQLPYVTWVAYEALWLHQAGVPLILESNQNEANR